MDEKLRAKLIQLLKDMAQQVADEADKIIPDVQYWTDLSIAIDIPSATEKPEDCPSISVSYNYLPKWKTIERLIYDGEEDGKVSN